MSAHYNEELDFSRKGLYSKINFIKDPNNNDYPINFRITDSVKGHELSWISVAKRFGLKGKGSARKVEFAFLNSLEKLQNIITKN